MNKIININLGGRMIAIDESAYEPLRTYINWLRQYFGKEADGLEIVQDMEGRIAEIFESKIRKGSPCILPEDVTSMIEIMGSPEQLHSENELDSLPPHTNESNQKDDYTNTKKRLHRNDSRKAVGGVCAGIADYFNIDPIIVRLAFVFFTLTWGVGLLIYIILWIALPVAQPSIANVSKKLFRNKDKKVIAGVCSGIAAYFNTQPVFIRLAFAAPLLLTIFLNVVDVSWGLSRISEGGIPSMFLLYLVLWVSIPAAKSLSEKLEMSGAKVDVQNISSAMRNEAPVTVRNGSSNVIGTLFKVFIFIVLTVILMTIISMIIGVVGLVIGYVFSPMKSEFPFYDLIITDNDTELILWTAITLVLITPLILILSLMKRILSARNQDQSNYWYKVLPVLFVLGIVGIVFSASEIIKNYKVTASASENIVNTRITSDSLRISTMALNSTISDPAVKFNVGKYAYLIPMNDKGFAFRNVSFEIKQASNDSLLVTATKTVSGIDTSTASSHTALLDYSFSYDDKELSLSPFSLLNKNNPFRFQQVHVVIYVPPHITFQVDEDLLFNSNKNLVFFNKRYRFENGLKGKWNSSLHYKYEDGALLEL